LNNTHDNATTNNKKKQKIHKQRGLKLAHEIIDFYKRDYSLFDLQPPSIGEMASKE
jgi:hypothetical protein